MSTTFVIVGAGLFGLTLANILSDYSNNILIIEKKNHIGGNCFDYADDETNIIVHKYGPHIIHLDDSSVYNFLSKFTAFNNYRHQVRTYFKNAIYEFPINLSTINQFYNINLRPYEVSEFLKNEVKKNYTPNPQNLQESLINSIGLELYEAFFKDYTIKQWGKHPKDLPSTTVNRIPIKMNYDTGYYKKPFNAIPRQGYTEMFKRMLNNNMISIELGVDFFDQKEFFLTKGIVIFTGPIDTFFDYKYGRLEYRSLRFEEERHSVKDWQGNSVINYPELKYEYTRICEPKHFYPERWKEFSPNKTILYKEIPFSGLGSEPYYPMQDDKNIKIYKKYSEEAKQLHNVYFGGRLGEYKYFDMEDTIKSAFALSKKLLKSINGTVV